MPEKQAIHGPEPDKEPGKIFLEKLSKVPFEQRDSEFLLHLIRGGFQDEVSDAIEQDQFPQTSLTADVAAELWTGTVVRNIKKFSPADHQKIFESMIRGKDSSGRDGLDDFSVGIMLKNLSDSQSFDRRTITLALLGSKIPHHRTLLKYLKQLDLKDEEIEQEIQACINGGYGEWVIKHIREIPNFNEQDFIRRMVEHPTEGWVNAGKILDHLDKFHVNFEWLTQILQENPEVWSLVGKRVAELKKT